MYQDHFGLYTAPFALVPHLRFLYKSTAFEETMAHLVYGLEGGEDIILISGEIGSGKTLALHNLVTHVSSTYESIVVNVTQIGFNELLKLALAELEAPIPANADRADLLTALNERLAALRKEGRRLLLVIDEAQNLSAEVLEGVRLLTNLGPADVQLVQIVLCGQPGLRQLIDRPELVQLRQRIRVHYHLHTLSLKETSEYIAHRLEVAGSERQLFRQDAVERIHELSGGVPRLVNILADRGLLDAYVNGADVVSAANISDEEIVRSPLEEVKSAATASAASETLPPKRDAEPEPEPAPEAEPAPAAADSAGEGSGPPPAVAAAGTTPVGDLDGIYIHVGSFRELERAERLAGACDAAGFATSICAVTVADATWLRVYVGPYAENGAAVDANTRLLNESLTTWTMIVRFP